MASRGRDVSLDGIALDASVVEALQRSLPEVSRHTVTTIIAQVPEYADTLRGRMGRNITGAVEQALATFLPLAAAPPGTDPADLPSVVEAAYALGRGEARAGRTTASLLAAYRVGARVSWERWGRSAVEAGLSPDRLVPFAALVFAYIDQLSAASVDGHADELATSGRVREQYRERLAVDLVSGAPLDELQRSAERAGWAPPRTLTCLLAPSAHTAAVRSSVDPSTLSVAGDAVAAPGGAGVVVHLVPDLGTRRATVLTAVLGRAWVLGPERPWAQAAASYQRATRALPLRGRGSPVLDTELHLAELVLTADPEAHDDLRRVALAPLAELPDETADRLAATLRSWLLHQGRREAVAADLHVHPQTVRYRMVQVRELFGDRLLDPLQVRDLVIALG